MRDGEDYSVFFFGTVSERASPLKASDSSSDVHSCRFLDTRVARLLFYQNVETGSHLSTGQRILCRDREQNNLLFNERNCLVERSVLFLVHTRIYSMHHLFTKSYAFSFFQKLSYRLLEILWRDGVADAETVSADRVISPEKGGFFGLFAAGTGLFHGFRTKENTYP